MSPPLIRVAPGAAISVCFSWSVPVPARRMIRRSWDLFPEWGENMFPPVPEGNSSRVSLRRQGTWADRGGTQIRPLAKNTQKGRMPMGLINNLPGRGTGHPGRRNVPHESPGDPACSAGREARLHEQQLRPYDRERQFSRSRRGNEDRRVATRLAWLNSRPARRPGAGRGRQAPGEAGQAPNYALAGLVRRAVASGWRPDGVGPGVVVEEHRHLPVRA